MARKSQAPGGPKAGDEAACAKPAKRRKREPYPTGNWLQLAAKPPPRKRVRERGLTPRQKRFVQEYLVDLNGKQAAIRAGFSDNKASMCGTRLLRNTRVGAAVKKAMEDRARRTRITADRVLREYARIAFADIRRVTNWDARKGLVAKPMKEVSEDDAAAIAEVRTDNTNTLRVRLHDKKRALDAIARHLGLFSRHEPTAESPTLLAERVRELFRARLVQLTRREDEE